MVPQVNVAVLDTKLDAHMEQDNMRFADFNKKFDDVGRNITRLHSRFDSLLRGVLFISLCAIGSLVLIVYNTLLNTSS